MNCKLVIDRPKVRCPHCLVDGQTPGDFCSVCCALLDAPAELLPVALPIAVPIAPRPLPRLPTPKTPPRPIAPPLPVRPIRPAPRLPEPPPAPAPVPAAATHPDIINRWKVAKSAAAAIAAHMGATILQLKDGTKRVIIGGRVIDSQTWLAAWSLLHQIRQDQLQSNKGNR